MTRLQRAELLSQGFYYLATGLWPIAKMRAFESVTGPKIDDWLVRMVGLLAAVIGGTLTVAAWRRQGGLTVWVLAVGAASAFAAIDIVYAAAGTISSIYLVDAGVEIALIAWLLAAIMQSK